MKIHQHIMLTKPLILDNYSPSILVLNAPLLFTTSNPLTDLIRLGTHPDIDTLS